MEASSDPYQWVLEAVDAHELPLLRYAKRLLGDLDLARDAVQHAFVKLCEEPRERIDGRIAPWLYRVCRNKALDHLRLAGRERSILDGAPDAAVAPRSDRAGHEADPARSVEDRDLAARLRELLVDLPAPQRETIDLWCEGLTYREIAAVTGRQEGHVRVLAHRGLTALRNHPSVRSILEPQVSLQADSGNARKPEAQVSLQADSGNARKPEAQVSLQADSGNARKPEAQVSLQADSGNARKPEAQAERGVDDAP